MKDLRILPPTFMMCLLYSCASFYSNKLPTLDIQKRLKIGQTSKNDIIKIYGEPRKVTKVSQNGLSSEIMFFSLNAQLPLSDEVRRFKILYTELEKGILRGYFFTSNFDEDLAKVDLDRIEEIRVGDPKSKLIRTIGAPWGIITTPSNLLKDDQNAQAKESKAFQVFYYYVSYPRPYGQLNPREKLAMYYINEQSNIVGDFHYENQI